MASLLKIRAFCLGLSSRPGVWTSDLRATTTTRRFDDGIPQNATYALELASALREMDAPPLPRGGSLLEVGCGIGRLVPWFLHGGMRYTAVETDRWASRYVREAYQVPVETRPW